MLLNVAAVSAHVCCGQTAGWIKMPLGPEVDLGPGHIVLDRDPASLSPRERGTAAPPVPHVGPGAVSKWVSV